MVFKLFYIHVLFFVTRLGDCRMSSKIVGGRNASISEFSYAAYLSVKCAKTGGEYRYWGCGSSILNEKILLTAAHCVAGCVRGSTFLITVGHDENKRKSLKSVHRAHSYIYHEEYCANTVVNDIALVRLKYPVKFGSKVSRVILLKNPPYDEKAQVAGWGLTSEVPRKDGDRLKVVDQYVWKKNECVELLRKTAPGVICASSKNKEEYASNGDSGSGLVIRGMIEIGIASYKMPGRSRSLVVYVDVGYFYNWILENAKTLLCT